MGYVPCEQGKSDAEGLAALRAWQDTVIQALAIDMKQMQKMDAMQAIKVLEATHSSHVVRLKYYLALTGEADSRVSDTDGEWQDIVQVISTPTKDELVMS